MAMPDQERLSEQATQLAGWLRVHGPPSRERLDEIADFVDFLARQLTEAERENERLRAFVEDLEAKGLRADLTPTMNLNSVGALYQHFAGYITGIDHGIRERARRALNTGEAQASPPKSSSGEALNPGGSEEAGGE